MFVHANVGQFVLGQLSLNLSLAQFLSSAADCSAGDFQTGNRGLKSVEVLCQTFSRFRFFGFLHTCCEVVQFRLSKLQVSSKLLVLFAVLSKVLPVGFKGLGKLIYFLLKRGCRNLRFRVKNCRTALQISSSE